MDIVHKGRENYLAWSTRLETMLTIDDIIERKNDDSLVICGQGAEKQKNEKIAKKNVIRNLSDKVMHTISASDPFVAIRKFYAAYGFAGIISA